ncbi:MAG: rRNA maturation RNase YbeY [Candidatus Aureabacteria bacterium]|nr:rRNA maturation RNase YbeY [Candidatus Auribacterota bacterium]
MSVLVRSQLKKTRIDSAEASRFARFIMGRLRCARGAELSVLFAGNRAVRRLNREYRGVDRTTDVLAFPLSSRRAEALRAGALGDVVISVDRARRCARRLRTTANAEILLYLTHGILHLCGFDDRTARGRVRMERRQEALIRQALKRRSWNVIS